MNTNTPMQNAYRRHPFHSMRGQVCIAFALVLAGFCAAGVSAQETPTDPAAPADLSSPRATLTNFLSAMNAVRAGRSEELSRALDSIYLLDIPEEEAEEKGRELANLLFEILDAITLDLDAVPEEVEGRDVTVPWSRFSIEPVPDSVALTSTI